MRLLSKAIGSALDEQAKRAFLGSAEKHGEPKIGSPARQGGREWLGRGTPECHT